MEGHPCRDFTIRAWLESVLDTPLARMLMTVASELDTNYTPTLGARQFRGIWGPTVFPVDVRADILGALEGFRLFSGDDRWFNPANYGGPPRQDNF